ncbi:MAG TPA: FkbM family methyltransferase [Polyangiaceae bacterium]
MTERPRASAAQSIADVAARIALRVPLLERAVAAGCRRRDLRKLGLGAIAVGYSRVLQRRELRIAELNGYRFWVNVAEPLGFVPYFFGEPGVVWLAPQLIREGDVCIDAGANVGHYSFAMASQVQPSGRVLSIEANPEFAGLLERSIGLNRFGSTLEVVPRALWSEAGIELTFYVSTNPANSGSSSLVDHGGALDRERPVRALTTTLDVLAAERGIESIRLVKIDVERAEDAVLCGSERLLRDARIDYLIVELVKGQDTARVLEQHAYRGYFLDVSRERLKLLADVSDGTFCDALFVSPKQRSEFEARFASVIDS